MFKFNYSKYNPGGIEGGGRGAGELIHERSFLLQVLVPKCPGDYTCWGFLLEF